MSRVLACLAVCVLLVAHASALYFIVPNSGSKCFIEEVPKDTLVLTTYRLPDVVNEHDPEIHALITETATGNKIVDQGLAKTGKLVFTSHIGGEHQICFNVISKSFFGSSSKVHRMHLRIDIGEQAVDYAEVAKTEHLSAIEVEVRKLIDKLNQVRHETQYQRDREEEFRNTSESTNSRIMWFSLGETLVLVLSGLYQVVHLKSFFKGKKLV